MCGDVPFYRGLTHHGYKNNGAMRLFELDNYAFGKHTFLLLTRKTQWFACTEIPLAY
jgi:hypothetical protein